MLTNLQGIRALAALGVVVFHFGLMPATRLPFIIGAAGVDLFFVLSGFIIAHSAARSRRHFLAHRLIRVLPPYWIATLLAALVTLQAMPPGAASGWLVQSLFYLPDPGGRPALIFVAWTLVYELAFYLLYWLALRLAGARAPLAVLPVLALLALVPLPGGPWPLMLEFALGIGIFLLARRGPASGPIGLALAALGLAALFALPWLAGYDPNDYRSLARVACWGLPAAMIVAGVVFAERGGLAIRNPAVLLLGASSYALYLLHPIVVGQLLPLAPADPVPALLACAGAVAITVLIAIGFHLFVEAPLLRRLRALLRGSAPIEQRPSADLMGAPHGQPLR
jgi:exopolysaccharide production protein ExoZ